MQERELKNIGDQASRRAEHTVFAVILAVSVCHLLNDMMQSLLPAIYPNLKADFGLSFGQVGIVTLV
jgi:FSR family fosmidomycin resistance protein-like MFS transporter